VSHERLLATHRQGDESLYDNMHESSLHISKPLSRYDRSLLAWRG